MGTDIHWIWEQKTTDGWEEIVGLDDSRDYLLFAWLAGVRNGVGFAGVPTFAPITPIAPLRGVRLAAVHHRAHAPGRAHGHDLRDTVHQPQCAMAVPYAHNRHG